MKKKLKDYFYDRLSPNDEASVRKMICEHAGSEELDSAMRDIFDDCDRAASHLPRCVSGSALSRLLPYAIAAAAVAALVICLPRAYEKGCRSGEQRIAAIEWVEESVPAGEKKTVTLPDGTVMHLNSCSRLTYPGQFSGDKRSVFVSGEAFVQVSKDTEHPFVINSGDIRVTVLGTTFNFKNYPESRNAELLLMEGGVRAGIRTTSGEREVRMYPGDKLRFDRQTGKIDLTSFSPDKYKAFYEDNSLHFFDVEMSDIAGELSRCFNQEIVVKDAKLAQRRYFAIFTNNETLDEVLEAMNTDGKMKITRSNGIYYLQSY